MKSIRKMILFSAVLSVVLLFFCISDTEAIQLWGQGNGVAITPSTFVYGSTNFVDISGAFEAAVAQPHCNPVPYGTLPRRYIPRTVDFLRYDLMQNGSVVMSGRDLIENTDFNHDPSSGGGYGCGIEGEDPDVNSASPNRYVFDSTFAQVDVSGLFPGTYDLAFSSDEGAGCGIGCTPVLEFDLTPVVSAAIIVQGSTIRVTSNVDTSWGIDGPDPYDFSGSGTGPVDEVGAPGTYTIAPASIPCYGFAVYDVNGNSGASTQSVADLGMITFNIQYSLNGSCAPSVDLDFDNDGIGVGNPPTDGPITIISGTGGDLVWTTSNNATSCTASGAWSGAKTSANGTYVQNIPSIVANSTFTITCTNAFGSAVDSVTVNVSAAPPPTVDLDFEGQDGPVTVSSGTSGNLTWTPVNATSCTASGAWAGSKTATSGTHTENTGAITLSSTYTITCTNAFGSAVDSVTVNVSASPPPTVDLDFEGQDGPLTVSSGTSGNLSWTPLNATSCTASGAWSGSKNPAGGTENTGAITSSSTYTITCTNAFGSAVDSVTVNVNASSPPTVTNVTISSPLVMANSTTQYTITVTGSDPNGNGNSIIANFIQINHPFPDPPGTVTGNERGWLAWSTGDYWPQGSSPQSCGGGMARIMNGATTPSTADSTYIFNLDACTSVVSGATRTTTFTVRFNTNYTTPITGNDIGALVSKGGCCGGNSGWVNFPDLFNLTLAPTVSNVTIGPSTNIILGSSNLYEITVVGNDPNGNGSSIIANYAQINHPFPDPPGTITGNERGWLAWSNGDFWPQGREKQSCSGTAGGVAVVMDDDSNPNTADYQYIHLVDCDSTVSGGNRTTVFTVYFDPIFTTPITGNDIGAMVSKGGCCGGNSGWQNFDINFNVLLPPIISEISLSPSLNVIPNGSNQYDITVTGVDPNGSGNNIIAVYAQINADTTDAGTLSNSPNSRGWLAWNSFEYSAWEGKNFIDNCGGTGTDAAILNGTTNPTSVASGFINLVGCSTSVNGNQRTVTFTVTFDPSYTNPITGNDIWAVVSKGAPGNSGWVNDDTNFVLAIEPAISNVTLTEPNYCQSGPGGTVSWAYFDPLGSAQNGYRVQVDNDPAFGSPEVDSCPTGGFTGPAFVQSNSRTNFASGGGVSFNSNTGAGHLIVVAVTRINSDSAQPNVTDTQGNTYSLAGSKLLWTGGPNSSWVFYAQNINGGPNTVNVTLGGATWDSVMIHEYSGMAITNVLDATTSAVGVSSIINSGSTNSTQADALIFGFLGSGGVQPTAGPSFIQRSIGGFNSAVTTEDRIVTAMGSYNAISGNSTNLGWGGIVAIFKAAQACSGGSSQAYTIPQGSLAFNTTYYARAMAWNAMAESNWTNMSLCNGYPSNPGGCQPGNNRWITPVHAWPDNISSSHTFIWTPLAPPAGAPTYFTDRTLFAAGSFGQSWLWNFGDSFTSSLQNPSHSYVILGTYNATLTSTDNVGSCSNTQSLNVENPLPIWREVLPQ